jgi:hypothetical protein
MWNRKPRLWLTRDACKCDDQDCQVIVWALLVDTIEVVLWMNSFSTLASVGKMIDLDLLLIYESKIKEKYIVHFLESEDSFRTIVMCFIDLSEIHKKVLIFFRSKIRSVSFALIVKICIHFLAWVLTYLPDYSKNWMCTYTFHIPRWVLVGVFYKITLWFIDITKN